MSPKDGTLVVRLERERLYPLGHLCGPHLHILDYLVIQHPSQASQSLPFRAHFAALSALEGL